MQQKVEESKNLNSFENFYEKWYEEKKIIESQLNYKYKSCLYFILFEKITISRPPKSPKTLLWRAVGPLTYESHSMMSSNEFLYHWDKF